MRNDDDSINRIIGLRGKVVHIEIQIRHSSDPGYLLIASLGKRDESLMKNIVKAITPYGFDSLLVNFAIHKSFKRSNNPSKSQAEDLLNKICNDLVSEVDGEKKSGLFGFLKKGKKKADEHETADENENEDRGQYNSAISDNRYVPSEPPKVEPKYKSEHILTGKAPLADKYPEFEEKRKRQDNFSTKNVYETEEIKCKQEAERKKSQNNFNTKNVYETEEIRRKQEAERKKREQEHQQKHVDRTTGEFNPYMILGLKRDVSCAEVKVKFKELIKKNNLSGIVHMSLQEKESKEAIVRDIIKAKDMIFKEKGCSK